MLVPEQFHPDFASSKFFSESNSIALDENLELNFMSPVEKDLSGVPFVWVSGGGEIITLVNSSTSLSSEKLIFTLLPNPCNGLENMKVVSFDGSIKTVGENSNFVIDMEGINFGQVKLLPANKFPVDSSCRITGKDKRLFHSKLVVQKA